MSLIPKAIELAFAAHGGAVPGDGSAGVDHALRVWDLFRQYRPMESTPLRRYEELGCMALLINAVCSGGTTPAALAADFSPAVAETVGLLGPLEAARLEAGVCDRLKAEDRDVQMLYLVSRLDRLGQVSPEEKPAEAREALFEAERFLLPWAASLSTRLAADLQFYMTDLEQSLLRVRSSEP